MAYKTPGVYVKEISVFPPSIAEVETAIPAFVGFTEMAELKGVSLTNTPLRIKSMVDFEVYFGGGARPASLAVTLDPDNAPTNVTIAPKYLLYYAVQGFFANGGGPCYIVSVGDYTQDVTKARLETGINALKKYDEPTIITFPEGVLLSGTELHDLQKLTLAQCRDLGDRFGVFDLREAGGWSEGVKAFRDNIGINDLKYGAAYTPHLETSIPSAYKYQDVTLKSPNGDAADLAALTAAAGIDEASLTAITEAVDADPQDQDRIDALAVELRTTNRIYADVATEIERTGLTLPPSGAIAGVYATVDRTRGVWKSPANVSLMVVRGLTQRIDDADQESLNVDANAGKSINAIRAFTGRGILVWGARTLAGNDNEWRYVSVRRFFNLVEESVKKSTSWAVFEPNAAPLWTKVKSMIDNYLIQKWREGALAGATPDEAFYVNVGLGQTMTAQDILAGRLIVEIGMAVVRPAEFIVLKFMHKMQES